VVYPFRRHHIFSHVFDFLSRYSDTLHGWACIFAIGLLHTFYFFLVGGSYERGDLSIVFSTLFGVLWLKEGHRQVRIIGAILITAGVIVIGLSG
jgi:drug/metabolite transporter (DMT)-like permease